MTATGVYHVYNAAKFRTLNTIFNMTKKEGKPYATSEGIAAKTGMNLHNVRQNLYHYSKKYKSPLIERLPEKLGNEYCYVITESGETVLEKMKKRMEAGKDLNFKHDFQSKQIFIRPTPAGIERGITQDTARKVVGLK